MARRPLSERIAAERQRAAKANERIRKLEAQERRVETAKAKRQDALIAAAIRTEMGRDTDEGRRLRNWLARTLDRYLERDVDRELMAPFLNTSGGSNGDDQPVGASALPTDPTQTP